MMELKTKYNVYYTDTDSIFVDTQLPEDLIGPELGQALPHSLLWQVPRPKGPCAFQGRGQGAWA